MYWKDLAEKRKTQWADLLTEGHDLLHEVLEINLINDWMGFTFHFDEAHEDSFLQKTQTTFTADQSGYYQLCRHIVTNIYKGHKLAGKDKCYPVSD